MKLFVLGIPHTQTSTDFTTCAFTMKAYHLCKMMHRRGHEVIHLGNEGSNPECSENVAVMPEGRWRELYGHPGTNFYNLESQAPGHKEFHTEFAANMRAEILKRCSAPQEAIICVTWGGAQQIAVHDLPQFIVESGIGYPHTWAKFRVFESHAWANAIYGQQNNFAGQSWYDEVIPNAFDPDHFEYNDTAGDYFLYFGRLAEAKGTGFAVHMAKVAGYPLKIVGQGDPTPFLDKHVEYLKPVGVEERKKLMAGARVLCCPTWYLEPFGGVNIEAQMSGTPVISTNWGVFPETVIHGLTGWRCRTLEEFEWAAKHVDQLSRPACRQWAVNNFSLDRVALMYEEYFQRLLNLNAGGFLQTNPNRTQLDYLRKVYPGEQPINPAQPLESPPLPKPQTEWEKATEFETNWWGLEPNERWNEEVRKQATYAAKMGLPEDLDIGPTTVLDIGCGPTSMLLRSNRHGAPAVGVDPLPVSKETLQRYAAANVTFWNHKAEQFDAAEWPSFEEAWIYNCLQHTEDPVAILEEVAKAARTVRIFEWINLDPAPGHPQTLTESLFAKAFEGWERVSWEVGRFDVAPLWGEYIALVVKRNGRIPT